MGRESLASQVGLNVSIEEKPSKADPDRPFLLVITDDNGAELRRSRHLSVPAAQTAVSHFVRRKYPDKVAELVPRTGAPLKSKRKATQSERLLEQADREEHTAKELRLEAERCERKASAYRQAAVILSEAEA